MLEKVTSPEVKDDEFNPEGGNVLTDKLQYLDSTKDLHPPHNVNPLSDSTTSSSPNHLLEEFADELALITFSPGNIDFRLISREKIKEFKLLIDELDLPNDFLPSSEYDSFLSEDYSEVDTLPTTNNENKVFNPGILIQENLSEIVNRVAPDKKMAIFHASLILEDFDPPLNEFPSFKEFLGTETLLSFSSKNEGKIFKPRILTSEKVHFSLILELSHQGYTVFKINQILKILMKIFLFSHEENIHVLVVPCLYFHPPDQL
nr:hypothetical protein [Tanacetum cinerariifolium]